MKRRSLLAALLAAGPAGAQGWAPDRPVRLVVPFAPGTTTDILGRLLAPVLTRGLGQTVVVDNRSGAGGTVGAAAVAQAAPDGTVLLLGTSGTQVTNALLMRDLPYDPARGFAPVATFARTPVVLGVRPALGVASVAELVALAKRRPLAVASAGTGTTGHLSQALLDLRGGIETAHVPYRDGGRAVTDLIGGTVDAMFYHPLGFLPHIQAGTVRPLAVTGAGRAALLPEVPTMAEAGLPDFLVEGWWGVLAPAGTPAPAVARLAALVNAALAEPQLRAALLAQGVEPMDGGPEALAALQAAELDRQRSVVSAARITAE